MQIKIALRFHFTIVIMAQKKAYVKAVFHAGKNVKQGEHFFLIDEFTCIATMKINIVVSWKILY